LQAEGIDKVGELNLLLTTDDEIRALNRRFRQTDAPTDVIAFPEHGEEGEEFPQLHNASDDAQVSGDIAISVDTAAQQAAENGLTLEQELCLLTIHGILHLLGYDDTSPSQRRRMRRKEREMMQRLYPDIATRR